MSRCELQLLRPSIIILGRNRQQYSCLGTPSISLAHNVSVELKPTVDVELYTLYRTRCCV